MRLSYSTTMLVRTDEGEIWRCTTATKIMPIGTPDDKKEFEFIDEKGGKHWLTWFEVVHCRRNFLEKVLEEGVHVIVEPFSSPYLSDKAFEGNPDYEVYNGQVKQFHWVFKEDRWVES